MDVLPQCFSLSPSILNTLHIFCLCNNLCEQYNMYFSATSNERMHGCNRLSFPAAYHICQRHTVSWQCLLLSCYYIICRRWKIAGIPLHWYLLFNDSETGSLSPVRKFISCLSYMTLVCAPLAWANDTLPVLLSVLSIRPNEQTS